MRGKKEYGETVIVRRSPSPSPDHLRLKLPLLISRHHNLKISFHQLQSQIRSGLLEAEDVFASLAMPLMQLVGMKTAEMAEEGRINAIINLNSIPNSQAYARESFWMDEFGSGVTVDSGSSGVGADQKHTDGIFKDFWSNEFESGKTMDSSSTGVGSDQKHTDATFKEESFTNKVNMAGKELVQQQKHQLLQLVNTLQQIKSELISSEDGILRTLADRKQSFQRFFQKVVNHIQVIHQSREDENFLFTVKVLKTIFNSVGVTLCSVEEGVEELVNNLAEKMYNPMVNYVHGVKEEMEAGTCLRLLSIVAEMEREMRIGRLQLEESKSKVKELEKSRLQFLYLLKGSDEGLMKIKDHARNVLGDRKRLYRHAMPQKVIGIPPDGNKRMYRPCQYTIPRVPLGSSPSTSFKLTANGVS